MSLWAHCHWGGLFTCNQKEGCFNGVGDREGWIAMEQNVNGGEEVESVSKDTSQETCL